MLMSAFEQQSKIQNIEDQKRQNKMQYDTAVFSLEAAREKARQEREDMTQSLPLQDELTKTLNDTTLDSSTKKRIMANAAISYGANRNTPFLVNAALSGVANEEKKKFTVGRFLDSTGQQGAGYIKELQDKLKRPLDEDEEISRVDSYSWLNENQKKEATSKYNLARKEERENEEREGILKTLEYGANKLKWAKSPTSPMDSDTLANPADEQSLDVAIDVFARDEEKAAAKTQRQKQALVNLIYNERNVNIAKRPMRKPLPSQREATASSMTDPSK